MTLSEILQDIHACDEDMLIYERSIKSPLKLFILLTVLAMNHQMVHRFLIGLAGQVFTRSGLNGNNNTRKRCNCCADKHH